jgi:hypothetical protein
MPEHPPCDLLKYTLSSYVGTYVLDPYLNAPSIIRGTPRHVAEPERFARPVRVFYRYRSFSSFRSIVFRGIVIFYIHIRVVVGFERGRLKTGISCFFTEVIGVRWSAGISSSNSIFVAIILYDKLNTIVISKTTISILGFEYI